MKILDMRGQPCPIPVVNAKKALAGEGATNITVLVDNMVAVQNLSKMAKGTGCTFSYETDGASFRVSIIKGDGPIPSPFSSPVDVPNTNADAKAERCGPVVLITSDNMGRGAEELGRILIKGFIFSLTQLNPLPEAVLFLNSGVQLTMEGSNTVPDLKELEKNGCAVYVCGTCVNYYKLTESLAVGSIVDMMFITNQLVKASCLITI